MKHLDSFKAIDENGNETTINIYQEIVSVATKDNPSATRGGMKSAITEDDDPCNRIDDDTFQVVVTGQIFRRIR